MTKIQQEIGKIVQELPPQTHLVAVSKFHSAESILEAYDAGQRIFGESYVKELQQKHDVLPPDIEWHFIGHLQTNKVKYIAPYISLIHAVDTPKLLSEISKQGIKCNRKIPCLLELHVAKEETKYGFSPQECIDYLTSGTWKDLKGAEISGIMCMASNVDDKEQIAREFEEAYQFFQCVKDRFFHNNNSFCIRSWGMSDDYPIAIEHGSTFVRIGTRIFGQRIY